MASYSNQNFLKRSLISIITCLGRIRGSLTMIKAILPTSFDFNEAVASVVRMHKQGVDKDWLLKRAACPIFDFDKYAARPGESLIHMLALGDGERIGPNRNGDFFPAAANERYHPTFMSAHYFHHHDNKDPSKAFGRVVAAARCVLACVPKQLATAIR